MSFPVSWLSVGAIPGVVALQQTAKSLSRSAQPAFGNLLPTPTLPGSGRSEPTDQQQSKTQNPSDELKALKAQITELVQAWKKNFGSRTDEDVTVTITGDGMPQVEGPVDLASALRDYLDRNRDLVDRMNALANQQKNLDPLKWMPDSVRSVSGNPLVQIRIPLQADQVAPMLAR